MPSLYNIVRSGCVYNGNTLDPSNLSLNYLPLMHTAFRTNILTTIYHTRLQQSFYNDTGRDIDDCVFVFPYFDAINIVKFECITPVRGLVGRNYSRKRADQAFIRGCSQIGKLIHVLEKQPDACYTSLGKVPRGTTVEVVLEYIDDLKHDFESNGIRYSIPAQLMPSDETDITRSSLTVSATSAASVDIIVDLVMEEGTVIRKVICSSHPSIADVELPPLKRGTARASLVLGEYREDNDFALCYYIKRGMTSFAMLEKDDAKLGFGYALMVQSMPQLQPPTPIPGPEIVFILDCDGDITDLYKDALRVAVKSLHLYSTFNICSSESNRLFDKSQSVRQGTLDRALQYINDLRPIATCTKLWTLLRQAIKRRATGRPLDILLLFFTTSTTSEQHNPDRHIVEKLTSDRNVRIFPLGIGAGQSNAFADEIARLGRSFAQCATPGERLDNRLIKMIRCALTPHMSDFTLIITMDKDRDECDYDLHMSWRDKPLEIIADFHPHAATSAMVESITDGDARSWMSSSSRESVVIARQVTSPCFPIFRIVDYVPIPPGCRVTSVKLHSVSDHGEHLHDIPIQTDLPVQIYDMNMPINHLAARRAIRNREAKSYGKRVSKRSRRTYVSLCRQFQIVSKWSIFVAEDETSHESHVRSYVESEGLFRGRYAGQYQRAMPAQATIFDPSLGERLRPLDDRVRLLIWQQALEGYWSWDTTSRYMEAWYGEEWPGVSHLSTTSGLKVRMTIGVIVWLNLSGVQKHDIWKLAEQKAHAWLRATVGSEIASKLHKHALAYLAGL